MEKEFLQNVYERLNNMDWVSLKKEINSREVYIWGADYKGYKMREIFNDNGVRVKGFIDTYSESEEENIYKPEQILYKGANESTYIVVSMLLRYKQSVMEQLKKAGFYEGDFFYPCNEWNHLGFEWGYKNISEYEKTVKLGKELVSDLDRDKFYFLLAGGHIGDMILALSFLYAVKNKMRIKNISVISSESKVGLAKLYKEDIEEILIMSENEIEAISLYTKSSTKKHYNIIGGGWEFVSKDREVPFPINQILYKTKHLGLRYDVKSKYIQEKAENNEDFNKFIENAGIKKNKSVILIPYAKSATMLPDLYWEQLAVNLSKKYEVYTNVGPGEKEIKGTKPIFIPFEYVVNTINYAGRSISIRCGLTDILALGNCNCLVLYAIDGEEDVNYSKVTSLYINGEESILYRNAKYLNVHNKIEDLVEDTLKSEVPVGGRIERNGS